MPLYTYVISFKGSTHVAQSSHSNFYGFINWIETIPNLSPALRQELAHKAYRGEFSALENKKHVWKKSIEFNGNELIVHAIQTQT
ncbi:hypothetical protein [Nitrosomonas ureae]|uniref:Uncharacterized protein n=1 Tax=Nitrosomonas ureae TaxID=44577 RepID=A0A1H5XJF5_9PROT|nr:hypothetical protein [Nitrosomonas ureae]SEG11605.1 hypothetical protein SAMN05216334_12817 [Nitrosomonas ureae]